MSNNSQQAAQASSTSLVLRILNTWKNLVIKYERRWFSACGRYIIYLYAIAKELIKAPRMKEIIRQWDYVGYGSMWVVMVSAFVTGAVFALQIGHIFSMFGSQSLIGSITCSALIRELAPLITGFFITGRAGSSMTAEIASMKASDQIDAFYVMAINPISILVMPRIWGCILALPLLSNIFLILGTCGAFMVASNVFDVDYGTFRYYTLEAITLQNLWLLFGKSFVFACIIGTTSCYFGLHARKNNRGISHATTTSVVVSLILILITNAIITFFDIVIL